jgi:hypothetical protein
MTLKDQIFADIDSVFLNVAEFGEEVTINGIALICVSDDDVLLERADAAAQGTYRGERLIFVKAADLPGRPSVESRVTFRGEPYFVHECRENMGMYEIRMGANRT